MSSATNDGTRFGPGRLYYGKRHRSPREQLHDNLIARFVAGAGAGLIWSNLGGYAARIVPAQFQGKAIAIAMAGTPIALSLSLPAGTFLGDAAGWQSAFGTAAVVSIALIVWAFVSLPNLPGQAAGGHVPIATILRTPGVRSILWVVAGFMVAHNTLYTYVGPLTVASGVGSQIEWVLLVFGVAALLSTWATGTYVDPHHRRLIVMSTVVLGASTLVLGFAQLNLWVPRIGPAGVTWGFSIRAQTRPRRGRIQIRGFATGLSDLHPAPRCPCPAPPLGRLQGSRNTRASPPAGGVTPITRRDRLGGLLHEYAQVA